jgi:hypothetical protein
MELALPAYRQQMEANLKALLGMQGLGALRVQWKAVFREEPEPAQKKKETMVQRLVEHAMSQCIATEQPAPAKRRNLKDTFNPVLGNAIIHTTNKTKAETRERVLAKCLDFIAWNEITLFCVGKCSGVKSARDAMYTRWKDRYSKHAGYTTMLLLYRDDGSDALYHKQREDRALSLEKYLHNELGSGAYKEAMDTRFSDAEGHKSKSEEARFYVYLAVGHAQPKVDQACALLAL